MLADQSSPYNVWFDGLDLVAAAKVTTAKLRLEMGNTSAIKWFEGIGKCRIDWGPGYRIYLARDGDSLIVLIGGGTKKNQQSDKERAIALHAEYKERKKAGATENINKGNKADKAAKAEEHGRC